MNYFVLLYLIIYVGHKLVPIIQLQPHVHLWHCKALMHLVSIFQNLFQKCRFLYIEFLTRNCLPSGKWSNVSYKPCVYPDVWELMTTFYISRTPQQRKVCVKEYLLNCSFVFNNQAYTIILEAVRIIELVGLSVSFLSVLISLLIFFSLK